MSAWTKKPESQDIKTHGWSPHTNKTQSPTNSIKRYWSFYFPLKSLKKNLDQHVCLCAAEVWLSQITLTRNLAPQMLSSAGYSLYDSFFSFLYVSLNCVWKDDNINMTASKCDLEVNLNMKFWEYFFQFILFVSLYLYTSIHENFLVCNKLQNSSCNKHRIKILCNEKAVRSIYLALPSPPPSSNWNGWRLLLRWNTVNSQHFTELFMK